MVQANQKNIAKHYDVSNAFFESFLGENMLYTVTHFNSFKETLAVSELNKMKNIATLLEKNQVKHILEIGCGWGSLLIFLAKEYGVSSLGITLSKEQYVYVQKRVKEEKVERFVKVQLIDFFDLSEKNKFDAVLSIGVLSHINRQALGAYFKKVAGVLKDTGIYYQDSITRGIYSKNPISGGSFMGKIFFPGSESFDLDFIFKNTEAANLEIISSQALRKEYSKTLEYWISNLKKISAKKFSEKLVRLWVIALTGAQLAFDEGYINNYELVFKKYVPLK